MKIWRFGTRDKGGVNSPPTQPRPSPAQPQQPASSSRHKLPDERNSITHKFTVGGHEGYLIVGLFEDGSPGEVFITMSKEGSTVSGFADVWAIGISLALQYGVPLQKLVEKYKHTRFEPMGLTGNAEIKEVSSVPDYVMRWLERRFL